MNPKIAITFVLALVLLIGAAPALGQQLYVEASRPAIVRANPDADAEPILRLDRGQQLLVATEHQTDRFYKVYLPDGRTGWVSSYVVRLHQGTPADAPETPPAPGVPTGSTSAERENAAFHWGVVGKPKGYVELVRRGYTVGYDPFLKVPMWVQYRLTRERSEDDSHPRPDDYGEDGAVPPQGRSINGDYENSGYDTGHMAPADDMRWNDEVAREANLLTNMAPQVGDAFNGSVWKTLENRVRGWVLDRELIIIAGPVFVPVPILGAIEGQPETDRQFVFNAVGDAVAVPTHFFKIVIDISDPSAPEALAFLMPHRAMQPGPDRNIDTHLSSIDSIELLTGLDLLPGLPDELEERLESARPSTSW